MDMVESIQYYLVAWNPPKFWLILYLWKGIANIVGPKIKHFCFPLSDRPIENGPDPKTFFMIWKWKKKIFFSFNKIHILQLGEFSVLLYYFQRILNSDCFEAFKKIQLVKLVSFWVTCSRILFPSFRNNIFHRPFSFLYCRVRGNIFFFMLA